MISEVFPVIAFILEQKSYPFSNGLQHSCGRDLMRFHVICELKFSDHAAMNIAGEH